MTAKTSVLYLQKEKFQYFDAYSGRIIEFRFVPEIVRDLDIINSELLENLIKVFVANSRIAPAALVFVLAENAYFTKDFLPPAPQKDASAQPEITKELLKKQAEEFIEHVPFDNVVSKTIPLKEGLKVCATNKDFYETIAIAFEHLSFTIESVLPGLVLGNGLGLKPMMDPPMANLILQKVSSVRQYNFLNTQVFQTQFRQESEEIDEVELERQLPKKANKKSIYALVGILPVLLGLVVVMYQQFAAPPPSWKTQASNPPTPQPANPVQLATPPPTNIPLDTTASDSGQLLAQDLTVQIVNTASSAEIAQTLMGQLNTYKFKSVSLQTQNAETSSSTLVSFSSTTPQDVRNAVLAEVKKLETNVIVQEKQVGTNDISIVLGQ